MVRCGGLTRALVTIGVKALLSAAAFAESDALQRSSKELSDAIGSEFRITFEQRSRLEERTGVTFGRDVDQQDALTRIRVGAQYEPFPWLKISAMGQDSRAFFYGTTAPITLRDSIDLHEAYIELFPGKKRGFGAAFGREMVNYGEARLIGVPQWSNVARTFDLGRMYYRSSKLHFEAMMVSPVKIRADQFNVPNLGERIWGTYNTFDKVWRNASFDAYALRHSQNRIGGWTGTGRLGTNSFGGRFYGPLPHAFRYSLEAVAQTGRMGALDHRAYAWYSSLARRVTIARKALDLSVEYKAASGTRAGATRSNTFDQLSPANHDKFGHEDLFGWRNVRNVRAQAVLNFNRNVALTVLYDDIALMQATDFLYNGQGRSIARSMNGAAGRHVGQEWDTFLTYKQGAHLLGAGFGHFFKGRFIEQTTPGVNPRYLYVFQSYSF